ncbi:hypothetical protein V6N12_075530 [Hibiscus sabdariffa]|uniref:Uncharacterized protein n=1 Tax=Hibiscus sabdariffa TaxID=183260 RepID=A0ABR2C8I6_9ROSI
MVKAFGCGGVNGHDPLATGHDGYFSEELTTVKVRNQLVDSHTGNVTAKESGTSLSHAPSSNVSVGPSNIGPLVHFDTIAVSSSEDDPVRSVDSIKRPRVHSLASLVSDQLDSSDASLCSLTDPKSRVSRTQ